MNVEIKTLNLNNTFRIYSKGSCKSELLVCTKLSAKSWWKVEYFEAKFYTWKAQIGVSVFKDGKYTFF